MKVVSLFDGISCLRVALGDREVEYHASEIDPNAIKVSKANYPDIKHLGDVRTVEMIEDVDLLCGGSPCTDLSVAKKDRKGLEGQHSSLFYEYLRVLRLIKPKWFILENVNSMPKKDRDIITEEMGVEPIMIDASLVSAQSRKRLFWTNIPVVGLPTDRKIVLKDILQPDADIDEKMFLKSKVNPTDKKNGTTLLKVGHIGNSNGQGSRVYSPEGKSVTLSANGGGGGAKTGLYQVKSGRDIGRRLNADGHRADEDKTIPIQRRVEMREDDKSGTITSVSKDTLVVADKIRKLTPIECERLQSLPDGYTKGISTTQRYRCLGNAFNVEVIKHILSFIPK
jgi:DNA (cytosine-5)-methyltransferase 3A